MRRYLIIGTLLLLHCASAIGIPLHLHYCRGQLQHVSAFVRMCCLEDNCTETVAEKACCADQTSHCSDTMEGCCDDKTTWVQEDVPALFVKSTDFAEVYFATFTPIPSVPVQPALAQDVAGQNPGIFSGSPPLFLLHRALIYYG